MNNKDIAKEWFDLATNDFESAKFLLNMKPAPFEIICYHCQQSVEKLLKGFIALNGGKVVRTHDLGILNKQCFEYDVDFKSIEDECIDLTDYEVQVRYPFYIELQDIDVKNAVSNVQKVIDFLEERIKSFYLQDK